MGRTSGGGRVTAVGVTGRAFRLVLIVFCACVVQVAAAQPLFVELGKLGRLLGSSRTQVLGFRSDAKGQLTRIPLQVQTLDGLGQVVMGTPTWASAKRGAVPNPLKPLLGLADRLVVDDGDLLPCESICEAQVLDALPLECPVALEIPWAWKITSPLGGAFWVVSCPAWSPLISEPPVRVDLKERRLQSRVFDYVFHPRNHMLLESFGFRGENPLFSGSQMHVLVDVPRFFPLHFNGEDFTSRLLAYEEGSVATTGEISFFLELLTFEVRLDLTSQVSAWRDALHIPVVLTLPWDTSSLRKGSGAFYGFQTPHPLLPNVTTDLPPPAPFGELAPFAPVRTLEWVEGDRAIVVGIRMPTSFAEQGFSPTLASGESLKGLSIPGLKEEFGIWYDGTRLRKGVHRFDVWFHLGKRSELEKLRLFAKGEVQPKVGIFPLRVPLPSP